MHHRIVLGSIAAANISRFRALFSTEESCPSVVCPPIRRRPGGAGGSSDVPVKFVLMLLIIYFDGFDKGTLDT